MASKAVTPRTAGTVEQGNKNRPFSDDQLADIHDYNAAYNLVTEHSSVISSDEVGTGFKQITNKNLLVDRPFLILMWSFHAGDFGDESEFVVLHIVTPTNEKFIVTDGSTGIYDQLLRETKKSGRTTGMLCESGLRVSEYKYCDSCGTSNNMRDVLCNNCQGTSLNRAETFYIA